MGKAVVANAWRNVTMVAGNRMQPPPRQAGGAHGEDFRLSRLPVAGGLVIRKEAAGPAERELLRREQAILRRLDGVDGVVRLARVPSEPGVLMLQAVEGVSLAELPMPVGTAELVGLARGLAGVLAGVHGRGVMHRDLNPAGVVVSGSGSPCLVDFTLAATVAEIRPEFTHHSQIVGRLPYLAPEQTGRTGRSVDQRADLYALGAVLYELATGDPPFGRGDPLRLSHDHLARVPVPPVQVNPAVGQGLSEIIMHLLEKEPDSRYQTAEGLLHDLTQVGRGMGLRVGEHDFPLRLRSPSRLVGRDAEIAALGAEFTDASSEGCPGVLVSGAAGVGKTSLVNELRPVVTASDGWFMTGKFDQYRRDQEYDAVRQAFRSLGRLLLAEPEEDLATLRERILQSVGTNVDLAAAALPEFAALLGVDPGPQATDPTTNQARAQRTAIDLLRAVASRKRPVVFVIDDLQWATRTPLGVVDLIFSGERVEGLLLVCAYREEEVDATHPLAPMLARWQRQDDGPRQLHLTNLPPPGQTSMIADILRTDPDRSAELAAAVAPHTRGNPFDTIELLNALRLDGVLLATTQGWRWDPQALHHRLGSQADPIDVLVGRIQAMPPATLATLEAMACLGGRAETSLLQAATSESATAVERRLAPALDDGLLVMTPAAETAEVRFRHDRIREAVLHRLGPARERTLRLRLAQNLSTHPALFAAAAQQYLPVVDVVNDPQERQSVARLFHQAAEQAKLLSNHAVVERLLTAAVPLIDPTDTAALVDIHTERHAALCSLGRLAEANDVYGTIQRLATEPLALADATVAQVNSLSNQTRHREAVQLGLQLLGEFGVVVPAQDQIDTQIERGIAAVYEWVATPLDKDLKIPEPTDPAQQCGAGAITPKCAKSASPDRAVAALINRTLTSAYFADHKVYHWLTLTALRTWIRNGPGQTLAGPVCRVPGLLIARRGDYRTGRDVVRRVIAASEARGYEPATSRAHYFYAFNAGHWVEPLEHTVARSQRAREGLIRGGDQTDACWTYYVEAAQSLEYMPTLDGYAGNLDAALKFAARIGNDTAAQIFGAYRRLVDVLRGAADTQKASLDAPTRNPVALAVIHVTRALAAALLSDPAELEQQTAAAMQSMPFISWAYPAVTAHLLRALALAERIRATNVSTTVSRSDRDAASVELDGIIDWLAARAKDAPDNLLHLLHLAEAERAWATGNFQAAVLSFDAAIREASTRQRQWHQALIHERAARFHLTHGAEHTGYGLLAQARQAYHAWGAIAKVSQLDWAYASLRPPTEPDQQWPTPPTQLTTGTIDLLAILAATQALSSQTSIEGLRARVVEILSAMTGATRVHLVVHDDDHGWLLATGDHGTLTPITSARPDPPIPLAALRYAERTRQPLLVPDATHDDRFVRDTYLAGLGCCSLLAVPILGRGELRAMLLLENHLIRGAFTTERLDAVVLVAGQLAVSIDNAMLYSSLERKVAERTEQLALANRRLELLSATDPLTGLSNRRRLQEVLDIEWRRAKSTNTPLALAMVDIDHFKLYNDHYGHAAGDRCLQRIAATLKQHSRDGDLVARYGGEEFAIVMPDTNATTATHITQRIHAAVTTLTEPHQPAPDHAVTISIGIAAATPTRNHSADYLIEQADQQLYRAKREGRNRICALNAPQQ